MIPNGHFAGECDPCVDLEERESLSGELEETADAPRLAKTSGETAGGPALGAFSRGVPAPFELSRARNRLKILEFVDVESALRAARGRSDE